MGAQQSVGLYPKRSRARDRLGGAERLHDTGPGLGQIGAVITAATERQQATIAVPIGQRRQLECRSGMAGAGQLQMRERITGHAVRTTLQDDKLRRKMF